MNIHTYTEPQTTHRKKITLWDRLLPIYKLKSSLWAIMSLRRQFVYFLGIFLSVIMLMGAVPVEKGEPSPVTGAVMTEEDLMDYLNTQYKVKELEFKVKIMENKIVEERKRCEEELSRERDNFIYSGAGLLTGVGLVIILLMVLP